MENHTIAVPMKRLSDKEVRDLKEVIGLDEKLSLQAVMTLNQQYVNDSQMACMALNIARLQMQQHKSDGQIALMKAEACKRLAGHVLAKSKTETIRLSPLMDMFSTPTPEEIKKLIKAVNHE